MEEILKSLFGVIFILFLVYQTFNWFKLQWLYRKLDHKEDYVSEIEAQLILSSVRKIYFWLASPYFFGRCREIYYLVFNSPKVNKETKKSLRKSLQRRTVRGLAKVY